MEGYPQIHLIINPSGVEKVQFVARDEKEQWTGLELYKILHKEICGFSKRVEKTLKKEI